MDGYQSIFNSSTLISNSNDIVFSDITPDSILYVNTSLNPAAVTVGSSLSFSAGTLNAIQGIRTVDTPTFAGLTIGSLGGIIKATAGVLSTATVDVDYQRPLSGFTNLSYAAGVLNLGTVLTGITSIAVGTLTLTNSLAYNYGGTGQNSYAKGDLLYASAINTLSKLTIGSLDQVLSVNASGLPQWVTIGSGVTSLANTDSNLTLSASTGAITINLASNIFGLAYVQSSTFAGTLVGNSTGITGGTVGMFYKATGWDYVTQSDVTGLKTSDSPTFSGLTLSSTALAETSGGTGFKTYTTGDILYCSSSNTLSKLAIGSTNQVLAISGGVPGWTNGILTMSNTANQTTVSVTLGACTIVLPSTLIAPGSITSTTYMSVGTYAAIGTTADATRNLIISRSFTSTSSTTYSIYSISSIKTPSGASANIIAGLAISDTYQSNTSNTSNSFYGIKTNAKFDATSSTITSAYGSYVDLTNIAGSTTNMYGSYVGSSTLTAGTVTNTYGCYIANPGIGTNRCGLYTDDLQVGGSLLSGSTKSGYLYIDTRLGIGQSANNVDRTVWLNRNFTSTSNTTYNFMATNSITTPSGAGAMTIYGMILNDTFTSNTSNTSCNGYSIYSAPSFTGSPVAFTNAYGIYSTVTGSGTITNAYGSYIATPSVGTNKVAEYCESFQCGGTISGTVPAGRPYDKYGYIQPIGAIIMICTTTVPTGWLYCNGQAVSRTTYADLYAVIGVAYGTGNGSTTFNVPDFRGLVPRGQNDNATTPWYDPNSAARLAQNGSATGNNLGSYQMDDMISHQHAITFAGYRSGLLGDGGIGGISNSTFGGGSYNPTGVPISGMANGNETRMKNVYVRFIIKY